MKEDGDVTQSEYNRLWLEEKLKDDDLYVCTTDTICGTYVWVDSMEDGDVDQLMKETADENDWVRQDHDFTMYDDVCYYGLFTGREIREENEKHSVTFK